MAVDLSFWSLIKQATFGVHCVMCVLLAASVLSWSLILNRWAVIQKALRQIVLLEKRLEHVGEWERLREYLAKRRGALTPLEDIYQSGLAEYNRLDQEGMDASSLYKGIQGLMESALQRYVFGLEYSLSLLGTIGSLSVYVGLLGTVLGVMDAFRSLGTVQQATLAMVAPGISEALITTALGLVVAIPAVYAYNRFHAGIASIAQRSGFLMDAFLQIVYRHVYSARTQA
jgi:biopolymer transport protein TolQ